MVALSTLQSDMSGAGGVTYIRLYSEMQSIELIALQRIINTVTMPTAATTFCIRIKLSTTFVS